MPVQKLQSTDGFIAFDLDDGPGVGVVRLAPKVLRDSAQLLARSTTYAAASFGLQAGGASAGLDATAERRDAALAAFAGEVAPLVEEGRFLPGPGIGVSAEDLAGLPHAALRAAAFDDGRQAAGAVAAASAAADGLAGAAVAVVGTGPLASAAGTAVTAAGATPAADAAVTDACDVVLVSGRAGTVDHVAAAGVTARFLVPLTPVPVTARALAVLTRAGCVVVPDFLSTAAAMVGALDAGHGDPVDRVRAAVADLADEGTGMWMAAVERAEAHLRSWQSELPFGRPLA